MNNKERSHDRCGTRVPVLAVLRAEVMALRTIELQEFIVWSVSGDYPARDAGDQYSGGMKQRGE